MTSNKHSGSCHCGAIGFSYDCSNDPANWSVRACQCRFCRSHDALSTSDSDGRISFSARDPELLSRYRFGLKTADFLLCRRCGVYIGAVIETDSGRFGIINTHALSPRLENVASSAPVSYDGEATADRVARREDRWSRVTGVPW